MKERTKAIEPLCQGWIEHKLNAQEMDYLWKCIDNKKKNWKENLVGNISSSYHLVDRGNWFFTNVITYLLRAYEDKFVSLSKEEIYRDCPYQMNNWWVNYQKQNEFNPLHDHDGLYSFVIWMKIPYEWKEQNRNPISLDSGRPSIGDFQFVFLDMLGRVTTHRYRLSSGHEGTMLFFPAKMSHQVYPFFNCDEERISISGNISINPMKRIIQ
tara:strand:- start:817 stop:1452 length:636 start_codon:yes stop_codon:yes gene_type:complete